MREDHICIAVLCFEKDKEKIAPVIEHLKERYQVKFFFYRKDIWKDLIGFRCIIAYIASGIVVRSVLSFLRNKWSDPAIIVLDKPLRHAVVLLGGHHGGNEVAQFLSQIGIEPVITTSMEFSDGVSIGVGFRKNVREDEIIDAIQRALNELKLNLKDVRVIATIEGKEKSAIVKAADILKKPLFFVKRDDLNQMDLKETKAKIIGVKNVAEGCALKFAKKGELLLPKKVFGGVTIAIAR
ncbi:MAG: cobalamin biosynthesis protein [Archaeoglobaceae archaeon]|nr:cobalamin biosynthesis protein [Archaeoglobaceae archaeon]